MTLHLTPERNIAHGSTRLAPPAEILAVASQISPSIVLPDREARALLAAAEWEDVTKRGCFAAGPAGVQVWSGPWDGPLGSHGSSEHLGSVDWSYDTPNRHYITIYRVLVTARGAAAGQTLDGLLARVLALSGIVAPQQVPALATPLHRDPFRAAVQRTVLLPN